MKYKYAVSSIQPLLIMLVMTMASTLSNAQDTSATTNKLQWLVQPYVMFPVMDGTIGLGQLPDAGIHANASDIFSNLQFGAMLYAEAYSNKWAFTTDIIYMDLNQEIEGERGILSGEAGAQQFVWELAALRKFLPWLEGGIGFRVVSITSSLEMTVDETIGGGGSRSKSISDTWFDPVIIARAKFPVKDWTFKLRGDVGGFGIGSDFTWQGQADVGYRFSKLFELGLGYRYIGIDYENGSGESRFKYDVDTSGPVLRFGFHF